MINTLTRVEFAPRTANNITNSYCGFCDTPIIKGSPRVVHRMYHAPGNFVRNNGDKSGFNAGGEMDLYVHPSCAFHQRSTHKKTMCRGGCEEKIAAGKWAFVSILGDKKHRCQQSETAPVWLCIPCMETFINTYREILRGHISESSQFDEPVAWSKPTGLFVKIAAGVGKRSRPKAKAVFKQMRRVFHFENQTDEDQAVVVHQALHKIITKAMKQDKLLGGKKTADEKSTKKQKRVFDGGNNICNSRSGNSEIGGSTNSSSSSSTSTSTSSSTNGSESHSSKVDANKHKKRKTTHHT